MSVSLANLVDQIIKANEPAAEKKRPSGICPDCKVRPRHISFTGKQAPYCKPCSQIRMKKYRKSRGIHT